MLILENNLIEFIAVFLIFLVGLVINKYINYLIILKALKDFNNNKPGAENERKNKRKNLQT